MVYVVDLSGTSDPDPEILTVQYTGVRFDPAQFVEAFDLPKIAAAREVSDAPAGEGGPKKPLPNAEQRRFAKLYLEIWGKDAREQMALAAVRSCYPDSQVGRDPFLSIFRELRGPGSRGKPPIRGK